MSLNIKNLKTLEPGLYKINLIDPVKIYSFEEPYADLDKVKHILENWLITTNIYRAATPITDFLKQYTVFVLNFETVAQMHTQNELKSRKNKVYVFHVLYEDKLGWIAIYDFSLKNIKKLA